MGGSATAIDKDAFFRKGGSIGGRNGLQKRGAAIGEGNTA